MHPNELKGNGEILKKCNNCYVLVEADRTSCRLCGNTALSSATEVEVAAHLKEKEDYDRKIREEEEALTLKENANRENKEAAARRLTVISEIEAALGDLELENKASEIQNLEGIRGDKKDLIRNFEMVTLDSHPNRKVLKTLGLATGVGALESGLFSLKSQSLIYRKSLDSARQELLVSALSMGANAVLGLRAMVNSDNPGSSTLAGGGAKSTEAIVLIGTAVVLD